MTTYQGMHGNYTILEPRLALGVEGEIFKIRGRSDLVLKRFFDRHRTTTRLNKLQAQIAAGVPQQLLPQLTWPVDIVRKRTVYRLYHAGTVQVRKPQCNLQR